METDPQRSPVAEDEQTELPAPLETPDEDPPPVEEKQRDDDHEH
jgi:hypothetical protein